jgi:hypothetical protein
MSFSIPMILHSGTDGPFLYLTPGLTFRAAIRLNVTPSAGLVKREEGFDNPLAWFTPVNRMKSAGERFLHCRH